jgi:hypothetical protein
MKRTVQKSHRGKGKYKVNKSATDKHTAENKNIPKAKGKERVT